MSRLTAWSTHISSLLVLATGLAWAWMLYLCEPVDEFALVNHPWQPTVQYAHVLTAPLLVFTVGLIWRAHVWARLRSGFRKRRKTGWALALSFAPMTGSGYLLQLAVDETWRTTWLWVHLATGMLWTLGYLVHPWFARSRTRTDPALRTASPARQPGSVATRR